MNKGLIVALREYTVTIRRRGFLFMTALFPILGFIGVGVGFVAQGITNGPGGAPAEPVRYGYVDQTGRFTDHLEQGNVVFDEFPNQRAGTDALIQGEIDRLYVIPEDYLSTGAVVQIEPEQAGIDIGPDASGALQQFLLDNLLSERLSGDEMARVSAPVQLVQVQVDEQGQPVEQDLNFGTVIFFLGFGFLVLVAMFASSGYLLQSLSEEKENRVMEILLSSITPAQLMFGKLLGLGAAGVTQVAIWLAAGAVLVNLAGQQFAELPAFSLPAPGLILAAVLYFALGYTFFAILLGAVGAVTSSHREANQITVVFILPGLVPIYLLTPLLENPDGVLARALTFIPFTAPMTAMIRMAFDGIRAAELALSLLVLAAAVALAGLLTLRLFRAYLLSFGQRPSVASIARTLVRG